MPSKKIVGMSMPYASGEHVSVQTLFSAIETALSTRFIIRRLPAYADWAGDLKVWREHLQGCDISISRGRLSVRSELALGAPILYLPLGDLPRGAGPFRAAFDHLRSCDTIVFSSSADLGIFESLAADCKAKRVVIPFAVDERLFSPFSPARRAILREQFGLPREAIVFLYAGRVTAEKNVHSIVALFKTLLDKHKDAHLMIVGDMRDRRFDEFATGPYHMGEVFARILRRHGHLVDRIHIHRAVGRDDLPAIYNLADAFINLTLHHDENFGFSQAEAMSCGLPVIGTDWGGLKDTIEHGRTGFKAETLLTGWGIRVDHWQVYRYCEELIASRGLRSRLGAAARQAVKRRFSRGVFETSLRRELSSCLGRRKPSGKDNRLSAFGRSYYHGFRDRDARFTRRNYALYEQLILPYCSKRAAPPVDADDMLFLGPILVSVGAGVARVSDPLWPAEHKISRDERTILSRLLRAREVHGVLFTERARLFGDLARVIGRTPFERGLRSLIAKGLVVSSQKEVDLGPLGGP